MGSPVASQNSRDISYLRATSLGRDREILICDYSSNDKKARGRAFDRNNTFLVGLADDLDGAGGYCWADGTNNQNASGHDACNWRYYPMQCGPLSSHGS